MYNAGFAIFSTASILLFVEPLSGTTGAWLLVGFRLLQGVGASFLFANSAALLTDAFGPEERGKAMGMNQVAFIGGSLIGLVVGGVLASTPRPSDRSLRPTHVAPDLPDQCAGRRLRNRVGVRP
ncbi:Major facilitator superfamily MFS-1, partial [mine drainage metagenome]